MDEKRAKLPPVLSVSGRSLPEAWENSIFALSEKGIVYRRADEADSGDQVDSCMTIEITNPDADPFSHGKGGTNAMANPLLDYYYEIMGAKDCWIKDFDDPTDTRWDYLYHERLASHPAGNIDQVEFAIKRLIERPFSRRTNIITWHPPRDTINKDTPCLQRLWFTIIPGEDSKDCLDMHYNFRSRNVMQASFGNMHGLYMLGCHIRERVEDATNKSLDMRVIENTDSFHASTRDYPIFLKQVERIKYIKGLMERVKVEKNPEELAKVNKELGYNILYRSRKEVVDVLKLCRDEVEEAIFNHTKEVYKGNLDKEIKRVHALGDRIFYLLDKYAPKVA